MSSLMITRQYPVILALIKINRILSDPAQKVPKYPRISGWWWRSLGRKHGPRPAQSLQLAAAQPKDPNQLKYNTTESKQHDARRYGRSIPLLNRSGP